MALELFLSFGAVLLLTTVIEIVLALVLGVRNKYDFLLVAGVNFITNPLLNIMIAVIVALFHYYIPVIVVSEIAVVFAEYALYKNRLTYRKIHPLLLSLILNAGSFFIGGAVLVLL